MIDLRSRANRLSVAIALVACTSVLFCASAQPQSIEETVHNPLDFNRSATAGTGLVNNSIIRATARTSAGVVERVANPAGPQAIRAAIVYNSAFGIGTGTLSPRATTAAKSWFSFDKVQHVTFGFLFTLGGQYSLVNKLDMSEKRALPLAITGSAVVGLGKELYDWRFRSRRHFSKGDLVADSLGILVAVGLILI